VGGLSRDRVGWLLGAGQRVMWVGCLGLQTTPLKYGKKTEESFRRKSECLGGFVSLQAKQKHSDEETLLGVSME